MPSCAKPCPVVAVKSNLKNSRNEDKEILPRAHGCVRTSDKLRNILNMFPQPPPPTPCKDLIHVNHMGGMEIITPDVMPRKLSAYKTFTTHVPNFLTQDLSDMQNISFTSQKLNINEECKQKVRGSRKSWVLIKELVSLVQLSVTATALAIYYLIYCYMQLIYYTLRSAVYFHQADAPMKITLTIVTFTGLIIGINVMSRMESLIGFNFRHLRPK